jgi:hypothetical protein
MDAISSGWHGSHHHSGVGYRTGRATSSNYFRNVTHDTMARSTIPAVAGSVFYGMNLYGPAWVALGVGMGVLAVRLAINVTKIYDIPLSQALYDLEEQMRQVIDSYPYLKIACLVFSLFVACFSVSLGMALGMVCGGITALTIDWERNEKEIIVSDAKEHGKGFGGVLNQLW